MNERDTEVLEQYGVEVRAVRRGRGAWVCDTDRGLLLLREYKGTVRRLEFEEQVLGILDKQGGFRVDQYVRNREGELTGTAPDGTRVILKEWFSDRECNVLNREEAVCAASLIAALHRALRKIPILEEWNLGSILMEPMAAEMERHNRELRRARSFIRKKNRKTEFELCVTGNFDGFFEEAAEAQAGLSRMEAQAVPDYLCHGDLNQHHLLMGENGPAIIEFSRMHLGVQVTDLYHFIRKVLEKHSWDLQLGMRLLEAYNRILPMSNAEREYLYYLFLYPEKYWKQLNFYLNSGKAWLPARNTEKLRTLEQQQAGRREFIRAIR